MRKVEKINLMKDNLSIGFRFATPSGLLWSVHRLHSDFFEAKAEGGNLSVDLDYAEFCDEIASGFYEPKAGALRAFWREQAQKGCRRK